MKEIPIEMWSAHMNDERNRDGCTEDVSIFQKVLRYLKSRIPKTIAFKSPFFQPVCTAIKNRCDYWFYSLWFYCKSTKFYAFLIIAVNLVMIFDALCLIKNWDNNTPSTNIINTASLLIPLALDFYICIENYNKRFNRKAPIDAIYDDVEAPDGWTRLTLIPDGEKAEKTYTYYSETIDILLHANNSLNIYRHKDYEKALKLKIADKEDWKDIFHPFLRLNHLESLYNGRQFYNEKKFGLSHELDEKPEGRGADNDEKNYCIGIHKTHYFDSYLTNIIPGYRLINNQTEQEIAHTRSLMPYSKLINTSKEENDREKEGDKSVKKLLKYDKFISANEPGVTTLLLTEESLFLWQQNNLAQSSSGKTVASGSGSADWNDCKKYLGKKEDNSFRKAIVYGMQRELWEESHGKRNISQKEFMNHVETRITGYFRWLKKAGKAEFVGITRFLPDTGIKKPQVFLLSPESSEVQHGRKIDARTIHILKESLQSFSNPDNPSQLHIGNYNVSCAMALVKLKQLCDTYCTNNCPFSTNCKKVQCEEKPVDVLFEDNAALYLGKSKSYPTCTRGHRKKRHGCLPCEKLFPKT